MTQSSSKPPRRLAPLAGEKPPAPQWFEDALAAPRSEGSVEIEGAEISFRRWGDPGKPGLLFVHGGLAHKSWWDFAAPFFTRTHSVAAFDLSGMGDSGWRDAYRMSLYADEAVGVAEAAGLTQADGKFAIVGHSFGGWVSLATARDHGGRLSRAMVLDSPIRPPDAPRGATPPSSAPRFYASQADAIGRFRLVPDQDSGELFLLDHIARNGLKTVTDSEGKEVWTWKFDTELWAKMSYDGGHPSTFLPDISAPLAFLRGAHSALVTDDVWDYMKTIVPAGTPTVSIPAAYHHLMMDQPIAIITALRTILAGE